MLALTVVLARICPLRVTLAAAKKKLSRFQKTRASHSHQNHSDNHRDPKETEDVSTSSPWSGAYAETDFTVLEPNVQVTQEVDIGTTSTPLDILADVEQHSQHPDPKTPQDNWETRGSRRPSAANLVEQWHPHPSHNNHIEQISISEEDHDIKPSQISASQSSGSLPISYNYINPEVKRLQESDGEFNSYSPSDAIDHEKKALIQTVSQLEAEIELLRKEKSSITAHTESLERSLKDVQTKLVQAESRAKEEETQWEKDYEELEENRMRLQLMEDDVKMLENERKVLADLADSQKMEKLHFEEECQKLKEALHQTQSQLESQQTASNDTSQVASREADLLKEIEDLKLAISQIQDFSKQAEILAKEELESIRKECDTSKLDYVELSKKHNLDILQLQNELAAKDSIIQSQTEAMQTFQAEVTALQKASQDSEAAHIQLRAELDTALVALEEKNHELDTLNVAYQNVQSKSKDAEEGIALLTQQIEDLSLQTSTPKDDVADLHNKLKLSEATNELLSNRLAESAEKFNSFEMQLNELKLQLLKVTQERDALREMQSSNDLAIPAPNHDEPLQHRLKDLESDHSNLKNEVLLLEEKVTDKDKKLTVAYTQLEAQEASHLKKLHDEHQKFQEKVQTLQAEIDRQKSLLSEAYDTLNNEKIKFNDTLCDEQREHQEKLQVLQNELESFKSQLLETESKLNETVNHAKELESRNAELAQQIQLLESQLDLEKYDRASQAASVDLVVSLEERIAMQSHQLADLEGQLEDLTFEREKIIEDAKLKILELTEEKAQLFDQNESMREAGAQVLQKLRKLEEEYDSLAAENEDLIAEKESIIELNNDLQKALELSEIVKREKENECHQLRQEKECALNQLSRQVGDSDANLNQIDRLRAELHSAEQQLSELHLKLDETIIERENLWRANEGLRSDNEQLRVENKRQIAERVSLLETEEKLKVRIAEEQRAASALRQEIESVNEEVLRLRSQLSCFEEQARLNEALMSQACERDEELNELKRAYADLTTKYESAMIASRELEDRLQAAKNDYDLTVAQQHDSDHQIAMLHSEVASANGTRIEMEATLKAMKDELDSLKEQLRINEQSLEAKEACLAELDERSKLFESRMEESRQKAVIAAQETSQAKELLKQVEATLIEERHKFDIERQEHGKRHQTLTVEIGEVKTKLEQLSADYSEALAVIDSLESDRIASNEEIYALTQKSEQVSFLESELSQKTLQIEELDERIKQLTSEMDITISDNEVLRQTINLDAEKMQQLQIYLQEVEARALSFAEESEQLVSEKEMLRVEYENIKLHHSKEVETLQERIQSYEDEIEQLKSARDDTVHQLERNIELLLKSAAEREASLLEEVAAWVTKYENQKALLEERTSDLANTKDSMLQLAQELNAVKAVQTNLESDTAAKLSELQNEVNVAKDENAELQTMLQSTALQTSVLTEEKLRLETALHDFTSNMHALEEQLREESTQLHLKDEEIHRLEFELKATRVKLEDQLLKLSAVVETQKVEINGYKEEIDRLAEGSQSTEKIRFELDQVAKAFADQQQKNRELEDELHAVKKVLDEMEEFGRQLQGQSEGEKSTDDDVDFLSNQTDEQFKKWIQSEGSSGQSESVLSRRRTAFLKAVVTKLGDIEKDRDMHRLESEDRQVAIEQLTAQLADLEVQLGGLRSELEAKEKTVQDNVGLEHDVLEFQGRIAELESLLVETQPLIQELEEKRELVVTLTQKLESIERSQQREDVKEIESADILFNSSLSIGKDEFPEPEKLTTLPSIEEMSPQSAPSDADMLRLEVQRKTDEINSLHEHYKKLLKEAEEKLQSYVEMNQLNLEKVEKYTKELEAKSQRVHSLEMQLKDMTIKVMEDAAQRESTKKTNPASEVVEQPTLRPTREEFYDSNNDPSVGLKIKALEALTQQIAYLTKSTETNLQMSQTILKEASAKSPTVPSPKASAPQVKPHERAEPIRRILESQADLMDEHQKLKSEIQKISDWLINSSATQQKQSSSPRNGFLERDESSDDDYPSKQFGKGIKVPIIDLTSLLKYFTDALSQYQSTADEILTQNYHAIRSFDGSPLAKPHVVYDALVTLQKNVEEVESQQRSLLKQSRYLISVISRHHNSSTNENPHESDREVTNIWTVAEQEFDSGLRGDYHLNSSEYADLVTKASQMESYHQRFENTQTLLNEHIKEIEVLKNAIEAMSAPLSLVANTSDKQIIRVLQKQVDELKKVWAHELDANMILRNLITKMQNEFTAAEEDARRNQALLREDFDELTAILEDTDRELSSMREMVAEKDKIIRANEMGADEQISKLNDAFQQKVHKIMESHKLETITISKSLGKLRNERDELLQEVDDIRASFGEKLTQALQSAQQITLKYESLEKLMSESHGENLRLSESVDLLRTENTKLTADYEQLRKQWKTTLEEKTSTDAVNTSLQQNVGELTSKLIEAEHKLSASIASETSHKGHVQNLKVLVEELKRDNDLLHARIQDLENSLAEKSRHSSTVELRYEDKQRDLESERLEIEARCAQKEKKLVDEMHRLERLLAQRDAELKEEHRLVEKLRHDQKKGPAIADGHRSPTLKSNHHDKLERDLKEKGQQIRMLQLQLEDVLKSRNDLAPLNDSRNREALLEKELKASLTQIEDIKQKCISLEEERNALEAQYTLEKERSKRLARKAEELKHKVLKYKQQQELAKTTADTDAGKSLVKAAESEDDLRNEIRLLRRELLHARQASSEIVSVVRETLQNTLGDVVTGLDDVKSSRYVVDMKRILAQTWREVLEQNSRYAELDEISERTNRSHTYELHEDNRSEFFARSFNTQ
ncbi:hypothetical protein HDV05_000547 [Chytridiales sp. JEL 0842]|nr:hypothetical protein HDV05_000547 [Chytridiales sp. JEL 0842]